MRRRGSNGLTFPKVITSVEKATTTTISFALIQARSHLDVVTAPILGQTCSVGDNRTTGHSRPTKLSGCVGVGAENARSEFTKADYFQQFQTK